MVKMLHLTNKPWKTWDVGRNHEDLGDENGSDFTNNLPIKDGEHWHFNNRNSETLSFDQQKSTKMLTSHSSTNESPPLI